MARNYLKKAALTSRSDAGETTAIVAGILADIEERGEEAALEYAKKFDKYDGNVQLTTSKSIPAAVIAFDSASAFAEKTAEFIQVLQ